MNDKKRLKILNKFINEESIVKGGDIKVTITDNSVKIIPKNTIKGMKYEDCVLLSSVILGANHLMFYLSRNGYDVIKTKKV